MPKLTQEAAVVPPKNADHIQAERRGVVAHERRVLHDELRLHLRQLLQNLNANIDEPVNIKRELHKIEEERHVLLNRQIVRRPGGKGVQHLHDSHAALPRDHVLVEVAQGLALLRGGLEVELVPRVLLDLAALRHVHAELLREQLADLLGHLLDGVSGLVAHFAHAVEQHVALVAVVLGKRVVLAQREVGCVQQMARRLDLGTIIQVLL